MVAAAAFSIALSIPGVAGAQQVLPAFQPVPPAKGDAVLKFTNMAPPDIDRSGSRIGPNPWQPPILQTGGRTTASDDGDLQVRTDLPGPERLFDTRKSEAMMREYIRRDSNVRSGADRVLFPDYPPLTKEPFVQRAFPRSSTLVEPNYVCHGRLYYEQPNFERAGWDVGYLTPGVTLAIFYYDTFMLPYHSWTNPCACYDCNAGKCSPGDNSPFYLYREQFSLSGLAAQTLVVGGGFFVFP